MLDAASMFGYGHLTSSVLAVPYADTLQLGGRRPRKRVLSNSPQPLTHWLALWQGRPANRTGIRPKWLARPTQRTPFTAPPVVTSSPARTPPWSSAPARHSPAATHGRRRRGRAVQRRSTRSRRGCLGWHTKSQQQSPRPRPGRHYGRQLSGQLFDGFVKVAALTGVPHRGAVQSAEEQLIFGRQSPAYRISVRLR